MKLKDYINQKMADPAFAEAYAALEPEFQIAQQVIALRLQQGLTQELHVRESQGEVPMKAIECVADMEPKAPLKKRVELGKYIVADPKIAFGKPTFKGTRKTPDGVLACFQEGHTLAEAAQLWGVSQEAVIEALDLARKAIIEYYRVPAAEIDMSQFDEELQKAKVSVCHETSYP